MPTFATPGPVTATVEVAGARVRVAASDRTDTVVLVEPRNPASRKDVKVAGKTKVDLADGQLTVKTITPDVNGERGAVRNSVASPSPSPSPSLSPSSESTGASDATVTVHARTRHGDIIIHRAAS